MRIPRTLESAEGTFRILDDAGECFATVALFDPLDADRGIQTATEFASGTHGPGLVVLRSGRETLEESGSLAWLPESRDRFSAVCDAFETAWLAKQSPGNVALWPQAAGVVSDAPSLQTFLRTRQRVEWRFIFDPAALITPAMAPTAEHHFDRLFAQLGEHPRACALVEDPAWTARWPKGWDRLSLTRLIRQSGTALV
jgi:hypothetical protein